MPDSLTPVYKRMHDQIRRFVASRVNDSHQTDDLVQDIFLRVHDHMGNARAGLWDTNPNAIAGLAS